MDVNYLRMLSHFLNLVSSIKGYFSKALHCTCSGMYSIALEKTATKYIFLVNKLLLLVKKLLFNATKIDEMPHSAMFSCSWAFRLRKLRGIY